MNAAVTAAVRTTVFPLMPAIRVPAGIPEAVTVIPATRPAAEATVTDLLAANAVPLVPTVIAFEP